MGFADPSVHLSLLAANSKKKGVENLTLVYTLTHAGVTGVPASSSECQR